MEDQNNSGGSSSDNAPDPIAQLKAESNRKLDGLKNEMAELKAASAVMIEALNRNNRPPVAAKAEESLTDLMYSDPERYAQVIEERAVGRISKQQEAQMRTQQVIGELHNEFPELNDTQSPLTKKAVEIYGALSDEEKRSTTSYKLAVKEAAAELGVKPRSKRGDEDFMPSEGNGNQRRQQSKADKLNPSTERWAELLGVDASDPEIRARLIEHSKRNFSQYKQPLSAKKKGTK